MSGGGRTWGDRLARGRARLEAAGIDEAAVKLRWVAAHLLGCGLLDVLRRRSDVPDPESARRFEDALARLETGEPVQYVIGETDFMGLRNRCDRRALIPRPVTELLAGRAEEYLRSRAGPTLAVDVCTGTGCIACALARRAPRARMIATDISSDALELARANARDLGVEVDFRLADLLEGIAEACVDLVVSNPPYVSTGECGRLERAVRDFEPRLALDGGADGLRVISRLVEEAAHVLTSGGWLMMEIGDDQAAAAMEILCRTNRFKTPTLLSDYAGRARVATAQRMAR